MDKSKVATKSIVNMTKLFKKNKSLSSRKVPEIEKYPFIYPEILSTTKCLFLIFMDFLTVLVLAMKVAESKKLQHPSSISTLPA